MFSLSSGGTERASANGPEYRSGAGRPRRVRQGALQLAVRLAGRPGQSHRLQGHQTDGRHLDPRYFWLRELRREQLRAVVHQLRQRESALLLQQAHIQARAAGVREGEDRLDHY